MLHRNVGTPFSAGKRVYQNVGTTISSGENASPEIWYAVMHGGEAFTRDFWGGKGGKARGDPTLAGRPLPLPLQERGKEKAGFIPPLL